MHNRFDRAAPTVCGCRSAHICLGAGAHVVNCRADQQERGIIVSDRAHQEGKGIEPSANEPFIWKRDIRDDQHWRLGAAAGLDELARDRRGGDAAHIDCQRRVSLRMGRPIGLQQFASARMRGQEGHAARLAAQGERGEPACRGGAGGSDAGTDPHRDALAAAGGDFFGRSSENRWIAPLQPDHPQAAPCGCDNEIIYAGLILGVAARAFAHADDLAIDSQERQYVGSDQRIVKDDIRCPEQALGLARKEFGIAGAGPDQPDLARPDQLILLHEVSLGTAASR